MAIWKNTQLKKHIRVQENARHSREFARQSFIVPGPSSDELDIVPGDSQTSTRFVPLSRNNDHNNLGKPSTGSENCKMEFVGEKKEPGEKWMPPKEPALSKRQPVSFNIRSTLCVGKEAAMTKADVRQIENHEAPVSSVKTGELSNVDERQYSWKHDYVHVRYVNLVWSNAHTMTSLITNSGWLTDFILMYWLRLVLAGCIVLAVIVPIL